MTTGTISPSACRGRRLVTHAPSMAAYRRSKGDAFVSLGSFRPMVGHTLQSATGGNCNWLTRTKAIIFLIASLGFDAYPFVPASRPKGNNREIIGLCTPLSAVKQIVGYLFFRQRRAHGTIETQTNFSLVIRGTIVG